MTAGYGQVLRELPAAPSLPALVANLDRERLRRYQQHLDFYQGKQWVGRARRRERRLTYNYARAIVDKATAYLMVGRDFAVDPPEDSDAGRVLARRTEQLLGEVVEANNLEQLDYDTELDAAVLGDGAYKVTWDVLEERVRVSSPDLAGLYCWWRPDDFSTLTRVVSRWEGSADEIAAAYGVAVGWRRGALTVHESWTATELEVWVEQELVERRENPYGFIPYVVFPNVREARSFWGVSDLVAVTESQRELNRALSQWSGVMELSGNPIAVLAGVTDSTGIAVEPGSVWDLPEGTRAELLDLLRGGSAEAHKEYVLTLFRTLHDLGETPRTAFGENAHQLSGVALNTELDPLLKKVTRKRLIRSSVYRRRNEMALRLVTQFTGEELAPYRSRVVWGAVLPQDRSRQVADERALVEAGIHSRKRAADQLGVEDPTQEYAQWLDEEARSRAIGGRGAEAAGGEAAL